MSSIVIGPDTSVHHHGRNRAFPLAVLVLSLSVVGPTALAREWKDSTGKHSVAADILAVTGDSVYLRKNADENVLSIPLERLSAADQRYAAKHRDAQKNLLREVRQLRAKVASLHTENARLRKELRHRAAAANQRQPAPRVVVVPAPVAATPKVIESRINGDFDDWEGGTVVKLINGQIWEQTEYHYEYHYAYMPSVLIYNSGGGYKMQVDGVDEALGVRRLK